MLLNHVPHHFVLCSFSKTVADYVNFQTLHIMANTNIVILHGATFPFLQLLLKRAWQNQVVHFPFYMIYVGRRLKVKACSPARPHKAIYLDANLHEEPS